ncbi:polymerase [Klebsiella phage KpLz-2_45]|uniref:polymerase n=1 Tax=Klebsiella phage KpLz-2_45 TaxID=2698923 RepID=UPI001F145A44|nr:polymerase [Klebsiella phage KpLz-2_45]UKS72025.1 hypothetical protein KpLz245_1590 [Klebsiella phage KpLz-2_45]
MADIALFNDIVEPLPKFNKDIAGGFAVKDLEDAEQYIDRIAHCAAQDFPPDVEYLGMRRLTPYEESQAIIKGNEKAERRGEVDIAQTDAVMSEMKLRFQKIHILPRNINIPFVREAGTLWLGGSRATIHPILADLVFSVAGNDLFTILFRAKFTLKRSIYSVLQDGESIPSFVVYGNIYQGKTGNEGKKSSFNSTLGHYLFCKYGVTETFKRFYDIDVVIEENRHNLREDYPEQDYVIFTTQGLPPPERRRAISDWKPTNLALIIPREAVLNNIGVQLLATHFFYVVDRYPQRFNLQYIDMPDTWRIIMGFILHQGNENEGKLLNKVDLHLKSLDSYVDGETKKNLRQEGIMANDLYELFIHILETIQDRLKDDNSGNMWGKYLLVKRYALSGITESIFNFTWQLEKEQKTLRLKRLTWKLSSFLTTNAFLGIQRGHGELNSVQYPGDNMIFKHTCIAIRQVNAVIGKGKTKSFKPNETAYHLHSSIMECGSVCNFAKGIPDGRGRLNVYAHTDDAGKFIRNPKNIELLDMVQREITE